MMNSLSDTYMRDPDLMDRFTSDPDNLNKELDKIDRFDRLVDSSYQISIQDKHMLKVDRVDRYKFAPCAR